MSDSDIIDFGEFVVWYFMKQLVSKRWLLQLGIMYNKCLQNHYILAKNVQYNVCNNPEDNIAMPCIRLVSQNLFYEEENVSYLCNLQYLTIIMSFAFDSFTFY